MLLSQIQQPRAARFIVAIKCVFYARSNKIDRKPRPIRGLNIVYPRSVLQDEVEGTCDVIFDISVLGDPMNHSVVCSNSVFERAALKAIKTAKFAPAMRNGQPVMQRGAVYPVVFLIPD